MTPRMTQKATCPPSPGKIDVHAEDARDQRQRQDRDAEQGQDPQDVGLLVGDDRLVRRLEPLDDLLVVLEEVPDALGGVDDVVEVELEVLREEALGVPLEQPQGRALGLDRLPIGDDLLLRVRDVSDDRLLARALEHLVLDGVELVLDLVEDREAVVEQVVQDVVEQVSRALREELVAQLVVALAACEEPRDGEQLGVRQRDEEVVAEEDVELGRVEPLDSLVVRREVKDDEEVAGVVVDLRPLPLREHVLDVELVEAEAVGELAQLELARAPRREPR